MALRLGWCVAEVRGRNRPGSPEPLPDVLPHMADHALPLRTERNSTDRRIEAQTVLAKLARRLGVDGTPSRAGMIDQQAETLANAVTNQSGVSGAWDALASSLYDFDANAQDSLAAQSETQASAYQLGRGLAEAYWALDLKAGCEPPTVNSWTFLLGRDRCDELTRIAGRLSAYFNPFAAPALAGTLQLWGAIARNPTWRIVGQADDKLGRQTPNDTPDSSEERATHDAHLALYLQTRNWYGLLIIGQDPATLTEPYEVFANWHLWRSLIKGFWLPLATALVSLGLVVALIALTEYGSHIQFLKALFGVLGVAGLSGATISTKLKSSSQSLLTRVHQDAYTDFVAVKMAVAPNKPGARQSRMRKVVGKEVHARSLTTVANARVP
jgi:hypothetical protein